MCFNLYFWIMRRKLPSKNQFIVCILHLIFLLRWEYPCLYSLNSVPLYSWTLHTLLFWPIHLNFKQLCLMTTMIQHSSSKAFILWEFLFYFWLFFKKKLKLHSSLANTFRQCQQFPLLASSLALSTCSVPHNPPVSFSEKSKPPGDNCRQDKTGCNRQGKIIPHTEAEQDTE